MTTTTTITPRDADEAVAGGRDEQRAGRQLGALLKQELVLQHRLLALSAQTREAIVERELATLERLRLRQEEILAAAEHLAGRRTDLSRQILRAAGAPDTQQPTLSRVLDCCAPAAAVPIAAVRDALIEVVERVQSSQSLNRELLENELDYIGASLEVVARAAAPRRDYRLPIQDLGTPAVFLDKAA
jgi:hypothetical protein